jgi:hypothetical protein
MAQGRRLAWCTKVVSYVNYRRRAGRASCTAVFDPCPTPTVHCSNNESVVPEGTTFGSERFSESACRAPPARFSPRKVTKRSIGDRCMRG